MAIKSLTDFVKENEINMKKRYTTQQIQDITWTNKQKKNLLARYQEPEKQNFIVRSMATVDNLAVNLLKGFVNTTEGAADTFSYFLADVEDFFGADKAAERTRKKTKEDLTSKLFDNRITEAVEGQAYNSKANQIANQIFYGAGNVAAMAGGTQALGGLGMAQAPATITTSFTTAYGNATSEALRNGDDLKTARIKGFINGTAEAISEQMFDALPGMKAYGWGDKVIGDAGSLVKKYFGTNAGKVAMKVFDAAGEGFEEIVSNVLTDVGNDLAHLFDKQNFDLKNPLKEFTSKNSWQQFLYASLTSALTNGSNTFINAQQKNAILKGYAKDNNITFDEAKKKFNQAVQEKTEVQKSTMTGTNLKEETELEEENKKKTLSEIVSGTFVEPGTSTQAYQYKTTDNELVNAMNKSIADSNGSNDYKTRTAAELATKIIEDLNVPVLFTNNEQLRSQMSEQQLQDTQGRTINGFVSDDGTMYLNLDSDELASFTVGHETKHFFESNKDMNDVLNKALKEYAVETGVYEKDLEDITKLYTDKNGNLFADPETELMADYVGKFFTDEEFVKNLSVKNPSFFKRIKDYFEKLYLRVTNQKEKLLVKQIKDTINKAYRQYAEMTGGKVTASEERLFKETVEQKKAKQRSQVKQKTKQKAVLPVARNVVEKKENVLPIKEKTQEKPEVKKETKKETKKVETKKVEKKEIKKEQPKKVETKEKTTLKEVVDEDLFNIDTKEIENQFNKETYNLNEDDGTEYEIDGTNFKLKNGNILEISTPYTYNKKTLDKIYQNEIDFTIIDENDNVIDEYSIKGEDNNFTKEDIIKAIKHMTYDDSNKVAEGQIDMFDNVHRSSGIKYSLSVKEADTTTDNEGRKLSKDQKQYFNNSVATDENGNLITVYHTTTDEMPQFNEFNPVGTPNYRFGDQVVNFYTNSKTMSGSYADYDYKMANTRTTKLNSMQEANKYITNFNKNNNDNFEIVKDTTTKDGYMLMRGNVTYQEYTSKNILLRSVVDDINNITGEKAKYQYEGYLNITNPYIVDAKESNWDEIITGYDEISVRHAKEIRQEIKDELIELADKSKVEYNLIDTRRKQIKDEIDSLRNREYFTVLGLGNPRFRDEVIPQFTGKEKTRIKNLLDEYYRITEKPNFPDNYFRDNVEELAEKIKQENNVYFEPMELYKMASNNFEDSAIEETFAKKDSTNDIIKYVLNENKQGRANYDGVIIQKVMDYGSTNAFDELGAAQDVYVTFNSNQFKAVDNKTPTEDDDIRYSISRKGETRSEKYDDFYKPKVESKIRLSDLKKKEPELPITEKAKTSKTSLPLVKNQETLRVAAENIAKEINTTGDFDTTKQRGWIESLKNSEAIEDKSFLKDLDFSKLSYQVQTNQKSLDTANDYIKNNGYDNSLNHVKDLIRSEKTPSASDIALMQRMTQEAIKNKDYQTAQDLIMDTAILGTDLGQAVQALSIIKKLTPEGQLKLYTKIVNRAKIRGEKSFKDVEITPKMVENVLGAYNEDGTYDQNDLNARVEEFKQDIATQMKATVADKVNAWRYLSMLGNPKTHIRNMVSNIAMTATTKVKNAMARTFESILPINERTKTWKQTSAEIKDYAKQTAADMKDIITGENKYNEKVALEQEKQVFKNKALEKVSRFNTNALEAEDWFFSRRAFEKTFSEYLTANGINSMEDVESNSEIIEKAKTYAVEQAEIATFRQYSKLASEISRIERNGKLSKYAINAVLPFKKTPINVAKAGFNYSPLGLIKNVSYDVYQLQKGNINASKFIDNLSQGLTGTSVALLGYALAKAGVLSGSGDDDKEDKYDKQLGGQSYALNIGGKSYSISWLSPTAMPLLVGSNLYEKLEEGQDWSPDVLMDTLAQTLDPMSEMSFLSSLTDTLQSYSNGGLDMIKNMGETSTQSYILQFFPTLLGQMASTFDDTKRSTKVSNNSKFKFGEETMRKIMLKIPGLRNQLEAQTDIWGNEKEQTDNILTRAFESFLAPYSKTEDISTSLDTEIKRVYNKTGEDSVIPGIPQAYIRKDSETYKMSASEYTQYKKTFGQTANQTLNELIKSDSYQQVSDEDKVKMIENVYKYAREQAKQEYFNNEGIDADSKKLDKFNRIQSQYGISASDYYGNMSEYNYADKNPDRHLAIKQIGDYDDYTGYKEQISAIKKSYSNKNDRKNAVFDYINSLPLSIEQKLILQKVGAGYSIKNERARLQRYIESLDLTANEKQRIDKVLFG